MINNYSVIILAAGNSSRMGKPKFLLVMPDGDSFLENITKQYSEFGCEDIIVVLNKFGVKLLENHPQNLPPKIKIVLNSNFSLGRFSSIKAGVKQVASNCVFIHNVDNPVMKIEVLNQLYDAKTHADVIKPVINNRGGHPILISKRVCDDILIEKENELNFKDFLNSYSTKEVEVSSKSILLNINTNEELAEFMKQSKENSNLAIKLSNY
ncbi:MAG: NTP transferase domain-containing protein [Bacteroidota bacterium]